MRFVVAGNFNQVHSTEGYVARDLAQLGHWVVRLQETEYTGRDLVAKVRECVDLSAGQPGPAVLLFSKLEYRGMPFRQAREDPRELVALLNKLRREGLVDRIACWFFDLCRPQFLQTRVNWANAVAPLCDAFFLTDSQSSISGAIPLRQGYPGPAELPASRLPVSRPILHLGEVYGERKGWVKALRTHFGDQFQVIRDGVHGDDLFQVVQSTWMILSPPYPSFPGYWSNRLYLVTGYSGLFAGPRVEGMQDEGWIAGEHYLELPSDTNDLIPAIHRTLECPADLIRIRNAGTRHCHEKHRLIHRCQDLVTHLERIHAGHGT